MKVQKVGEETCKECGSTYPIYKSKYAEYGECRKCRDKNLVPSKEELIQRRINRMTEKYSRIPADLENATFESYKPMHPSQANAKKIAELYATQFSLNKGSLVFSGTTGLGKSHLAYCIAKTVKNKGFTTLYIKSTDFLELVRSTYNNPMLDESKIFELIEQVDLLVLDDVGSEYIKQTDTESWASDILFKLTDIRQSKCNVYTTNYNDEGLAKKYGYPAGARIVSRILNNAQGMRLEGQDFRRRKI